MDNHCPVCGDPVDYCPGHGLMGDPSGWLTLRLHDRDIHTRCVPTVCVPAGIA